ncbi:hypothetical protein [Deinococcus ruber]|uniref:Uncharacterized protein n=1 Tax=Deinococcus ruber TaxID=1848197 RepID=A0A918C226_9DEIO|nr:hypothetical protein [Deinococcus ruber]GGR00076.1 hypothetical protein GCM10008957_10960 [Deinococcus ruber]
MTDLLVISIEGQSIQAIPNKQHEYTMTTEQVALGYGVGEEAIRSHKARRPDELIEGKHWVVAISNTLGGQQEMTLWTKRGIIRLGFFIRSARARMFRDMAEDLVFRKWEDAERGQPAPADALISARLIAASTGQSSKAVAMMMRRSDVLPTHHCVDPQYRTPAYLWPLVQVEAFLIGRSMAHLPLTAFTGEARPGVVQVQQNKRLNVPKHKALAPAAVQNYMTEAERLGAQLARELTEEFVRAELPARLRAMLTKGVTA